MFEKVLLATDGSVHAMEALKYARDLAQSHGSQVIVVHAYQPVSTYLGEPWLHRVVACHVATGRELADLAVQELEGAGIEVEMEVLEGPPADAILHVASSRQCDLIVMGCRGRGTLASLLLGSVSQRVLSHATIPVMIVSAREPETTLAAPGSERLPA
jgi:nucleotide-binding universal stress UspA family protein